MRNLENFVFFLTTAEERNICFIGERQQPTAVRHPSEGGSIAPGVYRVDAGARQWVGPLPEQAANSVASTGSPQDR